MRAGTRARGDSNLAADRDRSTFQKKGGRDGEFRKYVGPRGRLRNPRWWARRDGRVDKSALSESRRCGGRTAVAQDGGGLWSTQRQRLGRHTAPSPPRPTPASARCPRRCTGQKRRRHARRGRSDSVACNTGGGSAVPSRHHRQCPWRQPPPRAGSATAAHTSSRPPAACPNGRRSPPYGPHPSGAAPPRLAGRASPATAPPHPPQNQKKKAAISSTSHPLLPTHLAPTLGLT